MITVSARAATPAAGRYLGQLCKHFAHKIPVDYHPDAAPPQGLARFPWGGTCALRAEDDALVMSIEAPGPEEVERIKAVVGDHLERFAWREKLTVAWD